MKRVAWGMLLVGLFASPAAWGRQRVAVVIASDDQALGPDEDLSDSLGDVAIAALAEIPDTELAGTRELRRPLADIVGVRGWAACLDDAACLARVGAVTDAWRAVIGLVRRRDQTFTLEIVLVDTRAAAVEARVSRVLPPNVGALINGVKAGIADLLAQRPQLKAPPPSPTARQAAVLVAPAPSGGGGVPGAPLLAIRAGAAKPPPGRDANAPSSAISEIAYGAAGLSVLSFSGALVTGVLAEEAPSGATRAQKQSDLDRRVGLASVADGLLITGAVLVGVFLAGTVWHWHRAGHAPGTSTGSSP